MCNIDMMRSLKEDPFFILFPIEKWNFFQRSPLYGKDFKAYRNWGIIQGFWLNHQSDQRLTEEKQSQHSQVKICFPGARVCPQGNSRLHANRP